MLNDVDILFELGTEELPSGSVKPLAEALLKGMQLGFDKQGLMYRDASCFATPRRIAVRIHVQACQHDQSIERRGPAVKDSISADGNPTPALLGFAKSCGVDVSLLGTVETDKGPRWVYRTTQSGQPTRTLLPLIIQEAVSALSIPKPMRWGLGEVAFVRPVHWALLLLNDDVIELTLLGCQTGRVTFGHRFHHPQAISIATPSDYEQALNKAGVIGDFNQRKDLIERLIIERADGVACKAVIPADLLDEVASIVEWPTALLVPFNPHFLEVPSEALIAAMQVHQKCFALRDRDGNLSPYFITISNIQSREPGHVIEGNARVMNARLSDAAFFYHQDRMRPLSDYVAATAGVVFQEKLGSLKEKSDRINSILLFCASFFHVTPADATRAAFLCKADLMTAMVGEFPELEGVMGSYYARHDGESEAISCALKEHYLPRFSADELPRSPLGKALSLADRLDTLAGAFAVGLKPTAVKDPFKLRRHALAVIRILLVTETTHPLTLSELVSTALRGFEGKVRIPEGTAAELIHFILERMPAAYQGTAIDTQLILAVKARQPDWLFDFHQRVLALKTFLDRPEAGALASACKRVSHLLQHADIHSLSDPINEQYLEKEAEKKLAFQMDALQHDVDANSFPIRQPSEVAYDHILKALAGLREPVDLFFEQVMVMVDDEALKRNRLCLLRRLHLLMLVVADLSMIQ